MYKLQLLGWYWYKLQLLGGDNLGQFGTRICIHFSILTLHVTGLLKYFGKSLIGKNLNTSWQEWRKVPDFEWGIGNSFCWRALSLFSDIFLSNANASSATENNQSRNKTTSVLCSRGQEEFSSTLFGSTSSWLGQMQFSVAFQFEHSLLKPFVASTTMFQWQQLPSALNYSTLLLCSSGVKTLRFTVESELLKLSHDFFPKGPLFVLFEVESSRIVPKLISSMKSRWHRLTKRIRVKLASINVHSCYTFAWRDPNKSVINNRHTTVHSFEVPPTKPLRLFPSKSFSLSVEAKTFVLVDFYTQKLLRFGSASKRASANTVFKMKYNHFSQIFRSRDSLLLLLLLSEKVFESLHFSFPHVFV